MIYELKRMIKGEVLSTNETKKLAKDLYNDIIPQVWKKYNSIKMPINEWILDFKKRLD